MRRAVALMMLPACFGRANYPASSDDPRAEALMVRSLPNTAISPWTASQMLTHDALPPVLCFSWQPPAKKASAKKPAAAKKTIAKKPAGKDKALLFAPAKGSTLDVTTRIKAVIAVLEDAPVSEAKAQGAVTILQGVLKML